jgi:hypothetical protein
MTFTAQMALRSAWAVIWRTALTGLAVAAMVASCDHESKTRAEIAKETYLCEKAGGKYFPRLKECVK